MSSDSKFEGLVVVTIKITHIEGTNKCSFSDATENDYEKATFLKDIVMKPGEAPREFEATVVDAAEAKKIMNAGTAVGNGKPLFCVHGFNNEPSGLLFPDQSIFTGSYRQALQNFDANKKFFVVPVVWACLGGKTSYFKDRDKRSLEAAKALEVLAKSIHIDFPEKSLLCHSMGNRVLGQASLECVDAKFDNIFMVAADVAHDLFHAMPDNSNNNGKKTQAKNIFSLLTKHGDKPRGKIYILHNENDRELIGSRIVNDGETRLGCVGNSMRKKWSLRGYVWVYDESLTDTAYRGYISNIDCSSLNMVDPLMHNYQFEKQIIDTYEKKYLPECSEQIDSQWYHVPCFECECHVFRDWIVVYNDQQISS